jgi:hypothetical protein
MKVKNQHFVPRFYLKHFISNKGQINVYDKDLKKQFASPIEKVACEGYFYDSEALDSKKNQGQPLETFYSEIESNTSPFYDNFIMSLKNGDLNIISTHERQKISDYLVTQIDRTKEHREETDQIINELYNQLILKGFTADNLKHSGLSKDQINSKELHLNSILNGDKLRQTLSLILFKHIWIIYKNVTSQPFFTSDNPVVRYDHLKDDYVSNYGFGSPGIEIAFPLCPDYILVMADREIFQEYENLDGKVIQLDNLENIKYYNSLQVTSSYRQVFSQKDDFYMVEELFKIAPESFNLKRKRIG